MKQPICAVYGASGFGREVMPLMSQNIKRLNITKDRLVFIDDNPELTEVNGYQVLSYDKFLAFEASSHHIVFAIASGEIRGDLSLRCKEDGIELLSVRASNVVTMDSVDIGEGAVLSPFVTLTSNIEIGRHFHANIYSYVAHDCVIGDYVTFAPGVKCNGNVHIGDGAYIGTGAIIRQGRPGNPIRIGKGAIVGMGAVVTKDVLPGVTVVGNPARVLSKN